MGPDVNHIRSKITDSGVYQLLFEHHPDAVFVMDTNGNYVDTNPAGPKLCGYSREEMFTLSYASLILPEDLDRVHRHFQLALAGESQKYEVSIRHKTGRRVDLEVTNVPVMEEGAAVGIFGVAKDITEYKIQQECLRKAQELYQLISENSQDIISYSTPDGIVGYISPAVTSLLGYEPDEIIGTNSVRLYHPDDIQCVQEVANKVTSGEEVDVLTCRVRRKDGVYIWLETTVRLIHNAQAEAMILGVGRDITKRKAVEEELRLAQQDMVNTLQLQQGMTFKFKKQNERYVYTMFAGQLIQRLGFQPNNIIGQSPEDIHTDDVSLHILPFYEKAWSGESVLYETCLNGCTYVNSLVPVYQGGVVVEVIASGVDITKLKRTEESLQETKEQYRQLVENSPTAIGIMDGQKWVFMNTPGLRMFAAGSEAEFVGKNYWDFLHPEDHAHSKQRISVMIEERRTVPAIEQRWVRLNGDVFYGEAIGIPIQLQGKLFFQVIIRDITGRKKTQELLLKSEKLSAVGQLAAGVAHEIRNPLTALKGFIQLMHTHARGNNRRYFAIMQAELNRIEVILSELLLLAKPQAVHMVEQDISSVLREVTTLLSTQAIMNNVVIEEAYDEDAPLVRCEVNQLKQVFVNVIKNAIEAMAKGGRLLVRLRMESDRLTIQFSDQGDGIPEDRIPKLGEPFFSTKEKGTGLGLMVSQKIIQAHHGTFHVSSLVGQGTTVTVSLPIHQHPVDA